MYNFLLSETWWLETIIAAIISAGAALMGIYLMYWYKLSKIKDNTEQLSGFEWFKDKCAGEHSGLSKEHSELSEENDRILEKVEEIHMIAVREQTATELRYDYLSERNRNILELVSKEMGSINDKLIFLQKGNTEVKRDIIFLREELKSYENFK